MRIGFLDTFLGSGRVLKRIQENCVPSEDIELVVLSLPLLKEGKDKPQIDLILSCDHRVAKAEEIKFHYPDTPLFMMVHNSAPIKGHYWNPPIAPFVSGFLLPGNVFDIKTKAIFGVGVPTYRVPYLGLDMYKNARKTAKKHFDLVFACTGYLHYPFTLGIPIKEAFWHNLVSILAKKYKVAVLQHKDDIKWDVPSNVHVVDQPSPEVLFSGEYVITDVASNGIIARALGQNVLQIITADGLTRPCFAYHKSIKLESVPFLELDLGPMYGKDWTDPAFLDKNKVNWKYGEEVAQSCIDVHLSDKDFLLYVKDAYEEWCNECSTNGGSFTQMEKTT